MSAIRNPEQNSSPGLVVASSESDIEDRKVADFICDGVADEVEIADAIAALGDGGQLYLCPGRYWLANGLTVTTNKRFDVYAAGAAFVVPANVVGLTINQGITTTRGMYVYGLRIAGNSNVGNTGVAFIDTNWSALFGVQIEDCATGILMHCRDTNNFVEGIALEDVIIRNPTTYGIEYRRTNGTNSFGQHNYRGLFIVVGGTATGFLLPTLCSIYRSFMDVGVWVDTGQTAYSIDGDCDNAYLWFYVEGATGSTGNTGMVIGANMTNIERADLHWSKWGTLATEFTVAAGKDLAFRQGRNFKGHTQNTTAPIRIMSNADTAAKITLGINGTSGGRITLGNGTGTNDIYVERSGANMMNIVGQITPSSIKVQTKAGTPVDGDVVGTAADGLMIVDTTNGRIYARVGGLWKSVLLG